MFTFEKLFGEFCGKLQVVATPTLLPRFSHLDFGLVSPAARASVGQTFKHGSDYTVVVNVYNTYVVSVCELHAFATRCTRDADWMA